MPAPPMGPFSMPMMKDFVPTKLRPWIYLLFAAVFQTVQPVFAGSMAQLMGENALMREDVMMIVFCGLVGINLPFPFLFRYKFRFTNKSLLLNAACVLIVCCLLGMYVTWLPALCAINFIAGYFKLCGTFECFSNIQLWMTPKRDFSVFFPLLYMVVLNSIEWTPYLAIVNNAYLPYEMMNVYSIVALTAIALFILTCTKHFRFMKPMPLFGMDWLGMMLWAALMIEICYVFNYGEHYDWQIFRFTVHGSRFMVIAWAILPTAYFAINRERHVHHPFIDPAAWKYKNVPQMLLIFLAGEVLTAIPNVCQNAFVATLGYDSLHTARFYLMAIVGIAIGCGISYLWIHVLRLSYVRIVGLAFALMVASHVMMYFIIAPGINIERFYLPTILRHAGFAMNFCAVTIYLQQAMPFQHFFQGLTMMGFVRTGAGSAFGGALYCYAMRWSMADNTARYSGLLTDVHAWGSNVGLQISDFMHQMLLLSVKQIYGITCILGIFLVLFLLTYSLPVKSTLKKMPYWNKVAKSVMDSPS